MIKRDALARFAAQVKAEPPSLLAKPRYETRPLPPSEGEPQRYGVFDTITQTFAVVIGTGPFQTQAAADHATRRHNAAYERTLLP